MPYTIQCRGHVLGTTDLDLYQLVSGQHSGWLHPAAGAQHLLDAIAIGYPSMLSWLLRATVPPNGVALASSTFLVSGECQAITEAMAARLPFAVSLHGDDGTEVATTDIVLQDRHYWPMPWLEAELDARLTDEQRAEIDASIEHDMAVLRECHPEWFNGSADDIDDMPFDASADVGPAGLSPRYQVHLRLVHADDIPSNVVFLTEDTV
jgi:hypothetical protein